MSENKVQVSIKLPDGRIYVVGDDTLEQFTHHLEALKPAGVDPAAILEGFAHLNGVAQAAPATPQVAQVFQTYAQQQPAPQQPAPAVPGAPSCPHGPRTRREGTSSRGPWVGYFCPLPKGHPDQCKAIFQGA